MADHRSATEVTVAPLAERSALETFVEKYWKLGLLLFGLVAAGILFFQYKKQSAAQTADQGWAALQGMFEINSQASQFGIEQLALAPGDELESFSATQPDSGAGAWAQLLAASSYLDAGEPAAAREAVTKFVERYPNHPLADQVLRMDAKSEPSTVADFLAARLDSLSGLQAELPRLAGNPEPTADAPKVRLETSAGAIEIALFPDRAPGHVDNFLKLARDGTYAGTKFHRVMSGFMIQAGDTNSIEGEPETWGVGDPGYTLPQEFSDLSHFRGVLAMAKRDGETESSGHQFYVTVGDAHWLDGVHTVFGVVTSGMDVADAIVAGETVAGTDRPVSAVVINSVSVL